VADATTRERILRAALACFLEDGYERTTIARIRERSDVSNGALFHHFATKEAIAEALYVDAMASYQEGLWELLRRKPRSLRTAVRGTIENQLRWIEAHPDEARFVYLRGHLDWDTPGGSEVAALNRDLAAAFENWMAPLVKTGEIRPMSMLMISAIVSGPAHAIARRWLAGQLQAPPSVFTDDLADAACAGLRGRPAAVRRAATPSPRRGRVSLQLIAGDGEVLAKGQATADLIPIDQTG
jgi:AcrR family transcriptional regulator